ncbi:MAG TPA: hypothetical protein PKC28_02340 [Bdellovibrionales bacterium]|nr:hypothetical protein [Bdellovibrionales bacterium]
MTAHTIEALLGFLAISLGPWLFHLEALTLRENAAGIRTCPVGKLFAFARKPRTAELIHFLFEQLVDRRQHRTTLITATTMWASVP